MTNSKVPTMEIIECHNSVIADLLSDTEKILDNIDEYSNITHEYKFRNIKAYGHADSPYFQANCIFDYLFPHYLTDFDQLDTKSKKKKIKAREWKFTDWIKKNFQDENGNLIDCDIIKANIKRNSTDIRYYECYALSETGVLVAFCKQKSLLATTFRKHLVQFIKNVRKYYLEIYNEERVRSIKDLTKQLETERNLRKDAEYKVDQSVQLFDAFHNPSDNADNDNLELTILRRENMKQYYVYVVDWQYINSKYWRKFDLKETVVETIVQPPKKNQIMSVNSVYEGIDINSSDDENDEKKEKKEKKRRVKIDTTEPHPNGIQEPYNLFDINLYEIERNKHQNYYMCIRAKEVSNKKKNYYKFLQFIYITDPKHYKATIDYIINGRKYINKSGYPVNNNLTEVEEIVDAVKVITPDTEVFQTNYSILIDARNVSYIDIKKGVLINDKTERRHAK